MNSKLTLLVALLAFATIAKTAPVGMVIWLFMEKSVTNRFSVCSDIDEPAGENGQDLEVRCSGGF
jgi:hypothetical protein